jgi:hypothetical protein
VLGMAPFGAFQAGWVSEHFGVRTSLALGGVICLVVALGVGTVLRRNGARTGRRHTSFQPPS